MTAPPDGHIRCWLYCQFCWLSGIRSVMVDYTTPSRCPRCKDRKRSLGGQAANAAYLLGGVRAVYDLVHAREGTERLVFTPYIPGLRRTKVP